MAHWFDTHIHLSASGWNQSPDILYRQAQSAGIGKMLIPGVQADDWPQLLALARRLTDVYLAPGLHPLYADQWNRNVQVSLETMTGEPEVVAIGEIGLDAVGGLPLEQQEKVFRIQLEIALDSALPVLIHSRKTTGRVLAILREMEIGQQVGGVWHGFSGSVQTAEELVFLGFKIGVGPILLRDTARKLPQAVYSLSADSLVLETDAPDMIEAPLGLVAVGKRLAQLKGWSLNETARLTGRNAAALFLKKGGMSG